MPIQRLNHAVLYVRDAQRSAAFYGDVLGFRRLIDTPKAVFLQAPGSTNDHDLGLFSIGDGALKGRPVRIRPEFILMNADHPGHHAYSNSFTGPLSAFHA